MNIRSSLEKILQSEENFGDLFYEIFFDRCPAAADYFKETRMDRQALEVTMALTMIERHWSKNQPAIERYLEHLGTKHSDRGIPKELYEDWRDAILATLEQFHKDAWDKHVASQWRQAIDSATTVMFHGYDDRVVF